jgi:hypothetical protein
MTFLRLYDSILCAFFSGEAEGDNNNVLARLDDAVANVLHAKL